MCQMPNIWHIWHTKHKKLPLSDVPNLIIFATCEQYPHKFATVRTAVAEVFIIFLFHFLSHLSVNLTLTFTLKPQSSPLKPHSVSLSPSPCFSRRRRPARPWRLRAHQDADVHHHILCLRRSDPVAHRTRFLLCPRVHQDWAREPNRLPACCWHEFDFQHNQADNWVDRLGQGGDRAWVGVVNCWGDL